MFVDIHDRDQPLKASYDTVIVGAGAVGICIAISLARRGKRVALLEAGGQSPTQAAQAMFQDAENIGASLEGAHIGRFRNLGGTTKFWGGQLCPLAEHVLEPRDWVSDHQWPIPLAALAPYYRRADALLGMSKAIKKDTDVARTLGVTMPKPADTVQFDYSRWLPETDFAHLFKDELAQSENLDVYLAAHVLGINVDPHLRVRGVKVATKGGQSRDIHGAHVVLANGTLEMTRLMMMPTAAGEVAPWGQNPHIGRSFCDHVDCVVGTVTPSSKKRFTHQFENALIGGIKYSPKLKIARDTQRDEQLLDARAQFLFISHASHHLDALKVFAKGLLRGRLRQMTWSTLGGAIRGIRFVLPMVARYLRHKRIRGIMDGGILLRLSSEQSPLSHSRISLNYAKLDQYGQPNLTIDWRIDSKTLDSIARTTEHLAAYLSKEGFATLTPDPKLIARDPNFMQSIDDANHHMGGLAMAADAAHGVVDPNCRVFGVHGFYLAGAAVFPTTGAANPTYTAIALGLRLADHLIALDAHQEGHAYA